MKSARMVFRMICAGILLLAFVEIALVRPGKAEEQAEKPTTETSEATETKAADAKETKSVTADSVAQELENKRMALDERERSLTEYETRLKDREKDIDKKLQEMERLRQAVTGELEAQKKNNEERVTKLVAVFETMTPKSASAVFETLDDWLAVEVLKRMDIKRVAKVMNLMEKTRSAKLSEMLTGYYHPEADRKVSSIKPAGQEVANAVPAAPQNPEKKGGVK